MALPNMGDQFRGLPMADLIGGPLAAAADAQVKLANDTANFIKVIGFLPPTKDGEEVGEVRNVLFRFDRPATAAEQVPPGTPIPVETVDLQVPLLAIVKVPSLAIDTVNITFDMEVKNSETDKSSFDAAAKMSAQAQVGWGPFSVKVNITGSVSSHKENTRQSDQSAKYQVQVNAQDKGMPEGLARVLDIVQSSIAPRQISKATPPVPPPQPPAGN